MKTYQQSVNSMTRTREHFIRRFLSRPDELFTSLTKHRGLVGGLVAAAFILRDCSIATSFLEIFLPFESYTQFLTTLAKTQPDVDTVRSSQHVFESGCTRIRNTDMCTKFFVQHGRSILVYRVTSGDTCSGIARSITTASMCFLTEYTYGCAYPAIHLRRFALLSDLRLQYLTDFDTALLNEVLAAGFHFALSPTTWARTDLQFNDGLEENCHLCFRKWYCCPNQARFFGDQGSLVGHYDPIRDRSFSLRTQAILPYGSLLLWRLFTSFACTGNCDFRDTLLPEQLTTVSVAMVPDPFHKMREALG